MKRTLPWRRERTIDAALALLLLLIVLLSVQLIVTLREHQRTRRDLAELNDVKYGLLNADAWVQQVTAIIDKRINQFQLTPQNRDALKATLERMLDVLITQADLQMRKRKERQQGPFLKRTEARMKEGVREKLMDIDEVKAGIPGYADRILDELGKPDARRDLDAFLKNLLNDVSRSTFAEVDRTRVDAVHRQYQCSDRPSCHDSITLRIEQNHRTAVRQALTLLALAALLFGAVLAAGRRERSRLALLVLCCTALLACGVLTPMIEVEARISKLSFVLLGEPVVFTDQVLYFQSKSVLDVVRVLTQTGKIDMIVVGILIATFSVIFPLAKLVASFLYLYGAPGLRRSAVTQFFALKSGKWSMADVFVVAMFMAYIGFSGLISSQLSTFAMAAKADVDVLTTNGTSLQIGFFMFLAFCIASLLTSTLIDAAVGAAAPAQPPDPRPASTANR